jgi:arachidonate 15-lipoxygenase
MWKLRKAFWRKLALFKFSNNKPAIIPIPTDDGKKINAVSLSSQFSGIPIPNILVADRVPADEAQRSKFYFYEFQVAMYRLLSPMQSGLPPVADDPRAALNEAYDNGYRTLFPEPQLPAEYQPQVDLGRIAVASPYACYVQRTAEGDYEWDLRALAGYEHHKGLRSIGAHVRFRLNEPERRLEATQIDSELGVSKPGEANWEQALKIALCAATTHVSLVRHFNGVHLAAGGPFAIATRNNLPAANPLRRLLWPHMYGTQYSNQVVTKGQMVKGGDFETTFSFTHAGMCKLYADTYEQYDVTVLDPKRDAERRGIVDGSLDTPALANRLDLFNVMWDHARRYLRAYYDSDEALRADENFENWLVELDRLVPNGIRRLYGDGVSIESAARVIAAFIYLATVEHEILGTGLWNYQLWTNVQPVRIYEDGRRETLDVYQRLVNANFNLNVRRARLMQDYGYLALNRKGADAFRTFRYELQLLQSRMEQEPFAHWKIYPSILEANINA